MPVNNLCRRFFVIKFSSGRLLRIPIQSPVIKSVQSLPCYRILIRPPVIKSVKKLPCYWIPIRMAIT